MEQVTAFLEESDTLAQVIETHGTDRWNSETAFKGWTVNDILRHLHYWNIGADLALTDPEAFRPRIAALMAAIPKGGLRAHEDAEIPEHGPALFALWQDSYRDIARRWTDVDPKTRVEWVGPTMSARSSMTARQMETWAHGQAIFDLFGQQRIDSDRIKNIVVLGVNTFDFNHKIHGLPVPEQMPLVNLSAPSGANWRFGEPGAGTISGSAVEFCQVVTQTRNIADTKLTVEGNVARTWMAHAQCFAGGAHPPPAPGSRGMKR